MTRPFPHASRLGFGCASLGSRVGAKSGLDALSMAFERGINWFDLAPSYGDGRAEGIFARFAGARRDRIYICTKCGLAPPPIDGFMVAVRPMARAAVNRLPGLRRWAASARPAARRLALTGAVIHDSLDASLRRLNTDYVDVLALHDPSEADLRREDVATALAAVLKSGKARAVGVAGSPDAALIGLAAGLPVTHVQFADSPGLRGVDRIRQAPDVCIDDLLVVTHSVFSRRQRVESALQLTEAQLALMKALREFGYNLPLGDALDAAALDYALANNADGVVVASMFARRHLQANLERLASPGAGISEIVDLFDHFRSASASIEGAD